MQPFAVQISRDNHLQFAKYSSDNVLVQKPCEYIACVCAKDEKHDDEDFFQLIRHYHRQGAVLCCGGVKEAGQKQGLVPKHAFSLLQVRAVPVSWHSTEYFRMASWQHTKVLGIFGKLLSNLLICADLCMCVRTLCLFYVMRSCLCSSRVKVQIRNPWGTGEWKGPWCDESPLWDARLVMT